MPRPPLPSQARARERAKAQLINDAVLSPSFLEPWERDGYLIAPRSIEVLSNGLLQTEIDVTLDGVEVPVDGLPFLYLNPPVLVDHAEGDILVQVDRGSRHPTLPMRYKYAPGEAYRKFVGDTVLWRLDNPSVPGDPTLTVFASTGDGYIRSRSATAATMRSGGTFTVDTVGTSLFVGQSWDTTEYHGWISYLDFDTSALTADATFTASPTLSLYCVSDSSTTNFVARLYTGYDWSPGGLTSADWRTSFNTNTATFAVSGITVGAYNDFVENGTNLQAAINKTGITYGYLASNRLVAATDPTNDEFVVFRSADQSGTTQDPKLIIPYIVPIVETGGTVTATATITAAEVPYSVEHVELTATATVSDTDAMAGIESPTTTAVVTLTGSDAAQYAAEHGEISVVATISEEDEQLRLGHYEPQGPTDRGQGRAILSPSGPNDASLEGSDNDSTLRRIGG
jgi:hypothetical protein